MTLYGLNRPEKKKSTSSRMPLCYQITGFWGGGGHTIWPLASPKPITLTNSLGHNATLAQFVFCSIIWATQKSRRLVKTCQMCHRCRRSQSFISSSAKRTDLFFFWLFLSLSSHPFFYIQGVALRVGRMSQSLNEAWEKRNKFGSARAVLVMLPFVRRLVFGSGSSPRALPCLRPMQTAVDEGPCEGRVHGFKRHPQRRDQKQITGIDLFQRIAFVILVYLVWNFDFALKFQPQWSDQAGLVWITCVIQGFDMSGISFKWNTCTFFSYCGKSWLYAICSIKRCFRDL